MLADRPPRIEVLVNSPGPNDQVHIREPFVALPDVVTKTPGCLNLDPLRNADATTFGDTSLALFMELSLRTG